MSRPRRPTYLEPGLCLAVALLVACGGEPTAPPGGGNGGGNGGGGPPGVASVVVTPAADTLEAVGATVQLEAEARDTDGEAVSGVSFTWSSSDESVATVDDQGVVEAVSDGDAEITAAASGESGSSSLAVVQAVDAVSVSPASATLTAVGDTVRFTATALDAEGATVAGVDVAWSSGDTTVATVDDEGLALAVGEGTVAVEATVRAVPGEAELSVDPTIDRLEFATHPTDAEAGAAIDPAVRVEVIDRFGNPVEDASAAVTLSLAGGPAGATLLGTTAAAAVDGVATFDDLRIEEAAAGYTLEASTGGSLDPVTSRGFDVSPGPVDAVEFTTQPTDATAGEAIDPAVEVTLVDEFGNVATDAPGPVTVEASDHPSGGTLTGGSTSVTPVDGMAAFPGLVLETAAEGFTLDVRAGGGASGRSDAFTVLSGPAAEVAFLTHPTDIEALALIDPGVAVEVLDEFGNRASASSVRVTVNIDVFTDPTDGRAWLLNRGNRISTVSTGTLDDGVVTFEHLSVDIPAEGYRLEAGVPGLQSAESDPFDVHVTFESVSAGFTHACGVTARNLAYCWGDNDSGQLADGSTEDRSTPALVSMDLAFASVSAGLDHTCGITTDGEAYCWGSNGRGQLGDGSTDDATAPVEVATTATIVSISAGWHHTCATSATSLLVCWGSNGAGQIGDGTTTDRLSPVSVGAPLAWADAAAAELHSCAVTTGGVPYCWGENGNGQLGDGTTTDRLSPVFVDGGLTVDALAVGRNHTCGLDDAVPPELFCWGDNIAGQLGDGTTTDRSSPTLVDDGASTFIGVDAGFGLTCAWTGTRDGFCWGANPSGQIGDGTTDSSTTPVLVAGGHDFDDVSAGGTFVCGVTLENVALCWGSNEDGQLGDGTTADRSTPGPVVQ